MLHAPTGAQVVEMMAAGRAWWKLRACDVAPWIRSLPTVVRTDRQNRLGWLGRPWDGVSDLPIGEAEWDGHGDVDFAEPLVDDVGSWSSTVFDGRELARFVAELRRLTTQLPALGVAPPDHRDVRAALAGPEGSVSEPTTGMLVVDFDMGDLVLPLGIEDWQMRSDTWTPVERVAMQMIERLAFAAKHRSELLQRERRMRDVLEEVMGEMGGGAAALWLRLEPLRFDEKPSNLFHQPFTTLDVRLDHHQVWAPSGVERIDGAPKMRRRYRGAAASHRRRAARLSELRKAGSLGWISDVALALIDAEGRNPADVFREERDAALSGGERAHYGCKGHYGALFCFDGILHPYFTFERGCYCDGRLTLDGRFPHALASAAPGRPLAQFANHPAFVASGAVVDRALHHEERLQLFHTPRLVTVEEAERRWLAR